MIKFKFNNHYFSERINSKPIRMTNTQWFSTYIRRCRGWQINKILYEYET